MNDAEIDIITFVVVVHRDENELYTLVRCCWKAKKLNSIRDRGKVGGLTDTKYFNDKVVKLKNACCKFISEDLHLH